MAVEMGLAKQLAAEATRGLRLAKILRNTCLRVKPDWGRNSERFEQNLLKRTEDHADGGNAFVEKRNAELKGRRHGFEILESQCWN